MGRTPLWVAASTDGKLDFIKCLLEANANINVADAEEKSSPLQVSVSECVSLMSKLVESQVNKIQVLKLFVKGIL